LRFQKKIKKTDASIPIIIGGAHISGFPKGITSRYFDIGVIGEGEETLLELIRMYRDLTHKVTPESLTNVKGICFAIGGETVFTGYREFIKDIDTIPHFDMNFLKKYNALAFTSTSRGCLYDCKYCNSSTIWQKKSEISFP